MVLRGPQQPGDGLDGFGGGAGLGRGSAGALSGSLFSAEMLKLLSDARHGTE